MIGPFPMDQFLALHQRLATTPGPSGDEGPRRALLEEYFSHTALHTHVDSVGNLWVCADPDASWVDTVVLDAHIDVVERGFVDHLQRDGQTIRGLGVGDDLAAVAMLALCITRYSDSRRPGARPLTALFSVGEEGLGNLYGVRQAVRDHDRPPHLFIALDGSIGTFSMTGLGSNRYRTAVVCPGGHSWGDFGSPNAIEVLTTFLSRIKDTYRGVSALDTHPLSYNIGTIDGGEGINSIARQAEATYEFRSPSAMLLGRMDAALEALVCDARGQNSVQVHHELIGKRPGASPVHPERVLNMMRPTWGPVMDAFNDAPMSTNINVPLSAGWPSVCVGVCSYEHSHTEDERLHLPSLFNGWGCLSRLCEQLDPIAGDTTRSRPYAGKGALPDESL